ncbi:hypothetical protein L9F63_014500, partial [Diploptera punctata]
KMKLATELQFSLAPKMFNSRRLVEEERHSLMDYQMARTRFFLILLSLDLIIKMQFITNNFSKYLFVILSVSCLSYPIL